MSRIKIDVSLTSPQQVRNKSLYWNLGNDPKRQTQRNFVRANLLRTCYGYATETLRGNWCNDFEKTCYEEVANLLWTYYLKMI